MCALGVSLKREPLLPAVNEVEQRGGVYRPRHNGVIVTSGRGVVGGMAVGGDWFEIITQGNVNGGGPH